MTSLEKNIRFFIGTTIGNSTALYWIKHKGENQKNKLIYPDSDICIEGFQRSGNSFFFTLFKRRNKALKIAHHTHAAAQVIKAVEYNVPTIVLIRKPEDAIASLVVWDDKLSISIAFSAWISFYKRLLDLQDKIQITSFEEVTENPVEVINELNIRFDTDFSLPVYNENQLTQIKSTMKQRNDPLSAPVPTAEKDMAKLKYYDAIRSHSLLSKADELYNTFLKERYTI